LWQIAPVQETRPNIDAEARGGAAIQAVNVSGATDAVEMTPDLWFRMFLEKPHSDGFRRMNLEMLKSNWHTRFFALAIPTSTMDSIVCGPSAI
jgi:hypothetical protein